MLDDREKRRKFVLEQRKIRNKKKERQSKERGDIWKLFFEPNPEFAKFFLQPIPWLLGLAVFSIILVIVIDLFEFFTS